MRSAILTSFTVDSQVESVDSDMGSTSPIAPHGYDGEAVIVGPHVRMSLLQALWTMYRDANTVALGVAANMSADSIPPPVCGVLSPPAWAFVNNAISGAQVCIFSLRMIPACTLHYYS